MAIRLDIDYKNGSSATAGEIRDALSKLQLIADSAIAPKLDVRARDLGDSARLVLNDVPSEQALACFRAAVNMAGRPETPFAADTVRYFDSDTMDDLSGSLQRVYSV